MTASRPGAGHHAPAENATAATEPIVRRGARGLWLTALGVCLLVAGLLARFASEEPDGLERVATDQGIAEHAVERSGVLDYGDPVAALLGLGVVLLLASLLGLLLRRRQPGSATAPPGPTPR